MPGRRIVLAASAAWIATPLARAQPRGAPLRFGADRSLVASGLARALQVAFASDTGIDLKLVAQPALALLDAARDGEVDVALANAPVAEEVLAAQTLVHDRRVVAMGDFLLVGPRTSRAGRPRAPAHARGPRGQAPAAIAGEAGGGDPLQLLDRLHARAEARAVGMPPDAADAGPLVFVTPGDGSGAHFAEQALWRAARLEPRPPWYRSADPALGSVAAQARALGATVVLDRGEWLAGGGAPLDVLARIGSEPVHAMRSFRASHPAARMFLAWIGGRAGRAVVERQRGYRPAR